MGKNEQLKFTLMFDTNTSNAKRGIQDLQRTLNSLTKNIEIGEFPMTKKVQDAYVAAEKLKTVLNQAVNMDTGKLDFSRLSNGLKQAGTSVQDIANKFAGLGPQGVKAFSEIASSISKAEIPTKRMNALLDNFITQLKQSAQWQLSNSIIRGFSGALQSAYGYAKDLNRSLTDIRIVAEKDKDWMAQFAEEANRAAKALSTTTTEYTKASLIFFQQGLDDADVKRRTDAVIKMANVTGESADDISSYMTAVWNNFDDGSKSLEYYADVITALGAATASSSEEIATGIQKFASVADTVGLSYNYAASALATVVAATRQSEDTVGTSFKTIFARLSSLQLGETLEDDTTLTKYSSALAQVGVNIKDANGEIKSMDRILDELGAKWNNISRETQNALAYTVAGTRQYTNFIALMDNYDTFKINIQTAEEAEGTLEEQQKIYAESWQAAADEVRAAMEGIFQDLIDDDFFIDLLDGFEKLLSMLDTFIDAIGGLPGVLSLISTLMLRIFSTQAKQGLENLGYGLKSFLGLNTKEAARTKEDWLKEANRINDEERAKDSGGTLETASILDSLKKRAELEREYIRLESTLTEEQKEQYRTQMQILDAIRQQKAEAAKSVEEADQRQQEAGFKLQSKIGAQSIIPGKAYSDEDKAAMQRRLDEAKIAEETAKAAARRRGQERAKFEAELERYDGEEAKKSSFDTAKNGLFSVWEALGFDHDMRGKLMDGLSEEDIIRRLQGQKEYSSTLLASKRYGNGRKLTEEDIKKHEVAQARAEAALEAYQKSIRNNIDIEQDIEAAKKAQLEAIQAVRKAEEERKKAQEELLAAEKRGWTKEGSPLSGEDQERIQDKFSKLSQAYIDRQTSERSVQLHELMGLRPKEIPLTDSKGYTAAMTQWGDSLQKYLQEHENEISETAKIALNNALQRIRDNTNNPVDASTLGKIQSTIKNAIPEIDEEGLASIRAQLEAEGTTISDEDWEDYASKLKEYIHATNEAEKSNEEFDEAASKTMENLHKKSEKSVVSLSEQFIILGQVVAGVTTAISALKGAWETLTDPDVSGWDKFVAILSSITTVIMTLIPAISTLKSIEWAASLQKVKETVVLGIHTLATKLNTKARRKNADVIEQQKKEINDKINKQKKETVVDMVNSFKNGKNESGLKKISQAGPDMSSPFDLDGKLNNASNEPLVNRNLSGGNFFAGKSSTKSMEKLGSNLAKEGGKDAAIKAMGASGSSISALVSSLGSIMTVAGPILIAVAVVIGAIAGAVAIYNAAENSAKKAENAAKSMKKAAEETKQEYQETVEAISEYDKAQEGLKQLTKGTLEWRDALIESNDKARELIDRFGSDLKAGDYYFEDGQIKFKEGVLEELQEKEQQEIMSMQASADAAELVAMERREEADKIAFARKNMKTGQADTETAGIAALSGIAASIIVGPIMGAVVGGIVASAVGAASDEEKETLDKLAEAYRKDTTVLDKLAAGGEERAEIQEQLGISDEMVDALLENKKATQDLIEEMAANANEAQLLRESMMANANAGKEAYDSSSNQEYINVLGAKYAEDIENTENASDEYKKEKQQVDELYNGFFSGAFWDEYLKTMYGDDYEGKYRITNDWGGKATLQYYDEEKGAWVTDETIGHNNLKMSDARETMLKKKRSDLSNEEMEDFEKEAEDIQSQIAAAGISNSELVYSAGLDYLRGNGMNLSTLAHGEFKNITDDTIAAITDPELKEAMQTAVENTKEAFDQSIEHYKIYIGEINNINDNWTVSSLQRMNNALSNITKAGGENAANALNNYIDDLITKYPQKVEEISAVIESIEVGQGGEKYLANLTSGLGELGIRVDTTNEKWKELAGFIENIDINYFLYDLDSVREELSSIDKIVKDLSFADVITDEDFKTLEKYSAEMSNLFIKTINGYKYIGDTGALNKLTSEYAADTFSTQMENIALAKEAQGNNRLNKTKAANRWQDMREVANSSDYGAFLDLWGVNKDYLVEMADRGEKLQAKKEAGETLTDAEEEILTEAKALQNEMYSYATDLEDRDLIKEAYDGAMVSLSTYTSLEELEKKAFLYTKTGAKEAYDYYYNDILPKIINNLKESIDIYEYEEDQLERINQQLDKQSKISEKLHGKEKIASLQKELFLNKQSLQINRSLLETAKNAREEAIEDNAKILNGSSFNLESTLQKYTINGIIDWESLEEAYYDSGNFDTESFDNFKKEIQEAEEKINDYTDAIEEDTEAIANYWIDAAEGIEEYYDTLEEKINNASDLLDNYKEVVDLVGQSVLGLSAAEMLAMNEQAVVFSMENLKNAKNEYEELIDNLENFQEARNDSGKMAELLGFSDVTSFEEAYKDDYGLIDFNKVQDDLMQKAQDAYLGISDAWTESLSLIKDLLENSLDQMMTEFEKEISGTVGSLDQMSSIFEQQSELNNQYLDNYKKTYEINKLMRNIQKSIDETDNAKSKRVLNSLQAELNAYQADGVEMSEYDLNLMQKKYEMRLAEIALEEAQNSKNQVRLQKMADGSWGYVYTQNAEAIDKAQQDYEDKLYNLRELNDSYLNEVSQQIINIEKEFMSSLKEAYMIQDPTERQEAIDRTIAFYKDRLSYFTSEMDKVLENNEGLNMVTKFADTLLGKMYPEGFDSADSILDQWINKVGDGENGLIGSMNKLVEGYDSFVKKTFNSLGVELDNFMNSFLASMSILQGTLDYETMKNALIEWDPKEYTAEKLDSWYNDEHQKYKIFGRYATDVLGFDTLTARRLSKFVAYDTGGYTGEWGPEGRLALLHQKEIVLNAKDTENLLQVIDVVDTLIRNIDFESAAAAAGRALTAAIVPSFGDTLQQEVTIHAEFPNATNHSEIEEAFNTLINRATQYVNRK